MITAWSVLFMVWAGGTVYHAPRVLKRWVLITTCEPMNLCQGCGDERRKVMHEADEWEVMGSMGGPLMVMIEAMGWYLKPVLPALRKAAGREPLPKCSKGSCLAYTGGKAAA